MSVGGEVLRRRAKSRAIARLRQLANGATPVICKFPNEPWRNGEAFGLCADLWHSVGASLRDFLHEEVAEWAGDCYMHPDETGGYVFMPGDWGPERRTLAALLAAYIETEL